MFNLSEIFQFIESNDKSTLKDYYDKSYDTLKEINKRSNLITFFILVIFTIYSFSNYIIESSVLGFKINQTIIKITSPLLLSYFILEWCLIARRRRELMKIMKHIGINIFNIPASNNDLNFNHFSLHSRNVIPFSFMIEFINVDVRSKIHAWLFLMLIFGVSIGIPTYIGICLYNSFVDFKLTIPITICNCLGVYCLIQIVLFYINEIKAIINLKKEDEEFIKKHLQNNNEMINTNQ